MRILARWVYGFIYGFIYGYRRPLRILAVYQVVLVGIAACICLVQGRLTAQTLGETLMTLSVGLMTFAVLSGIGGMFSTQTFEYQFVSTISRDILANHRHAQEEKRAAFSFITNMLLVCGVSLVLGLLIAGV